MNPAAVLTIVRFTLQEALRRRLILAGILLSLAFLALFGTGFAYMADYAVGRAGPRTTPTQVLGIFGPVMTLLGLYALNFLASFLALFLSVGAISGEIDSGAIQAVLARPLRRAEFVLGRWLAYCGLMAVYVAGMAAALLLLAYVIAGFQAPSPLGAIALMVLSAVLLLSLSLFGSTRLSTLANGVVVFSLFGLAWMAGIIEFVGTVLNNDNMRNLGIAVSLLVPSDALWRGASYLLQPASLLAMGMGAPAPIAFASGSAPTVTLIVWSVLYIFAFLGAGMLSFARRDL